jgi:hypothetical protein
MKTRITLLLLFISSIGFAQNYTPYNKISVKSLKLDPVAVETLGDDVLIQGADKTVKKISVSTLMSGVPPQVNADWNATVGVGSIFNKPVIPSIEGLADVTYVDSQDSGLQTQISNKQATLVSGSNIKTINGNSLIGSGDIVVGGNVPNGILKTLNGTILTSSYQYISDNLGNKSPLKISITGVTSSGSINGPVTNTAFGSDALTNSDGSGNSMFGRNAGKNASGYYNSGFGISVFANLTYGSSNSGIGINLFSNLTVGNGNSGIGGSTGTELISGNYNTVLGYNSGRLMTNGDYNTIIGTNSSGLSTGSNYNVVIGALPVANAQVLQNNIILADGQGNKRIQIDSVGKTNFFGNLNSSSIPVYNDNASASSSGLLVGDFYRTSTGILMVRY